MKKKVPSKIENFLIENRQEIIILIEKKIELFKMILDYKKSKNELEMGKEILKVKREEIKSKELIELQKIKSSLEEKKAEYEFLMKNRELEHKEKIEKLEIIKNQLEKGNDLINNLIKEIQDKEFVEKFVNKFYEFQLEVTKVLKDL